MSFNKDVKIHKLQEENDMLRKLWAEWEEVPDEDLWEDGELSSEDVKTFIYTQVVQQGVWRLIRRIEKWRKKK